VTRRKRRPNGGDAVRRLIPALILVPPDDPRYMAEYMRLRYRHGRLDADSCRRLEAEAERLLKELARSLERATRKR